jgi:large subunit ribosomal protein L15
MKLHDLKPAEGSRQSRMRVGRGIAAGKGKTAGRGTKGQKARAGGSIPPWFEGGQTPLHMRIPKLRGFKNKFRVDYEIVNLGDIARLLEAGRFEPGDMPAGGTKPKTPAPITVNAEILKDVGLVRSVTKPLKVLGGGAELSTALFVVADAFSRSAVTKIEAAGGTVSVLEVPTKPRPAIGVTRDRETPAAESAGRESAGRESGPAGRRAGTKPSKTESRGTKPGGAAHDAAKAPAAAPSGRTAGAGKATEGPSERPAAGRRPRGVATAADAETAAESEAATEVASDDSPTAVAPVGDLATPTAVADATGNGSATEPLADDGEAGPTSSGR